MAVGGSLNSLFLDQLVEILWGGKEVGRWLEDARRWYGVVWVWIWHGMGFWYGCGHMMLSRPWWSVGQVDSALQKGYKNCPRIWGLNFRSSLVVGEIWKKIHPGWSGGFFFGSQLLRCYWSLRRHLSTAHTCRAGSVWRELFFYGKSEHNPMEIWLTGLEFPAALCCSGLRIYNKTLFHWTIIMARRDRAVPRSKLIASSGGLLCISSLCDQWPAGPALEI